MKEIDEIVVEMHSLRWRENAKVIGVAYARYSCYYQFSIADQIRGIFELAVAKGIFIPRENIYFDLSVRGSKDRRAGLNQVRATLQRKSAKTLIVFATNRLYRKQYKAIKFVEEEVVSLGLDCYFVV